MDHSIPVVMAGDIVLLVVWLTLSTFVVRYYWFSPWRSEPAGVALMGFMSVTVIILTFGMATVAIGIFPGAEAIRLLLYLLLALASWRFLKILVGAQNAAQENAVDPSGRIDTPTDQQEENCPPR